MSVTTGQQALPSLPHWESAPDDLAAAIRELKPALRARIEASGRTVEEVFAAVEARVLPRVQETVAAKEAGEPVWPTIDYEDIARGTVTAEQRDLVTRRGCLVVRGHFEREQALGWDADIVEYVERNDFFESYRGPGDDFFGSVGSKPEIYPIYWSRAQMEARQSERMASAQSFLNSFWSHESQGEQWFDPERD
ncbi:MAG: YbiU family protein, partial [Janibacter sp.]